MKMNIKNLKFISRFYNFYYQKSNKRKLNQQIYYEGWEKYKWKVFLLKSFCFFGIITLSTYFNKNLSRINANSKTHNQNHHLNLTLKKENYLKNFESINKIEFQEFFDLFEKTNKFFYHILLVNENDENVKYLKTLIEFIKNQFDLKNISEVKFMNIKINPFYYELDDTDSIKLQIKYFYLSESNM